MNYYLKFPTAKDPEKQYLDFSSNRGEFGLVAEELFEKRLKKISQQVNKGDSIYYEDIKTFIPDDYTQGIVSRKANRKKGFWRHSRTK